MFRQNCKRTCILLCIAFLCLWTSSVWAQGYGTISGTVTDPTGAVVANATIKLTQPQTGREITVPSNKEGLYVFPTVLPSTYTLSATAAGFQSYSQPGVILQANQSLNVSIKLQVGQATDVIEVTGAIPQVDTTSGTLSQVIDENRVVDIPLNGRNAAGLITLVAGVVDAGNQGNGVNQGNGKTFPAAVVTSANGTLPNQSNYLLNGGNNLDEMTNVNSPYPMPDAVQEFSVQTSNYDAQYGQSAGAVVNIVTKSGTNKFHGDAFEFLRNGYFNAKPWDAQTADALHRHQFGGTIGGPVLIPHVSKGNSTQFFFGYQHTLIHNKSNTGTVTLPTAAEKAGDLGHWCSGTDSKFSNAAIAGFDSSGICRLSDGRMSSRQIFNPFTNQAYAFNRIPVADMDPAALAWQKAFGTFSGTEVAGAIGGTVPITRPNKQFYDEYIARVDHRFGSKDQFFAHYFHDYWNQVGVYDPNDMAQWQGFYDTRYQNALISEQHTFTNTLFNNFILNYSRTVALRGGPPGSPNITSFGVQNIWQPNTGPFLSTGGAAGYFQMGGGSAAAVWIRNNYTLADDIHWVKGNHNIAFGLHFELSRFDVTNVYQSYGSFAFGEVNPTASNVWYTSPYANYLLGFMGNFFQGNYEQVNDRNKFPGLYAQDSWKVNRKLTLNYGLRWEQFSPWEFQNGNLQYFDPQAYVAGKHTSQFNNLPAGFMLNGVDGRPRNGADSHSEWMPRFGFAYDLTGDGKTVVRGGAGAFYQTRLPGFFNLNQGANIPNTLNAGYSNGGMLNGDGTRNVGGPFSNPYCTGGCGNKGLAVNNPFPFTLPLAKDHVFPSTPFEVLMFNNDFHAPVTYSYNLTVERQLANSWAARLAYVGSASRHQFVNVETNPAVNNGTSLDTNLRRVYHGGGGTPGPCTVSAGCVTSYVDMVTASMIGNASFNSLQATLNKKMSHGLYFLANLTWSKTTDDMPRATRGNMANMNPVESYVYPVYPDNAVGIPAAARVADVKALDRGLSDIDHPLVFSLSYRWDLPKLQVGNGFLKAITNGWAISGTASRRSGDTLIAYSGSDTSKTSLGQDRAQYDASKGVYYNYIYGGGKTNCQAGKSCVQWINPAAFSQPIMNGPGTGFGNVGKSLLRGPGYFNMDGAVAREFPFWREGTKLQFRAEYFNLLNHTNLRNPGTTANSSTFGSIVNSYDPRIAQFALKFIF